MMAIFQNERVDSAIHQKGAEADRAYYDFRAFLKLLLFSTHVCIYRPYRLFLMGPSVVVQLGPGGGAIC